MQGILAISPLPGVRDWGESLYVLIYIYDGSMLSTSVLIPLTNVKYTLDSLWYHVRPLESYNMPLVQEEVGIGSWCDVEWRLCWRNTFPNYIQEFNSSY